MESLPLRSFLVGVLRDMTKKALIFGAGRMGLAVGYDLEKHGMNVFYADSNPSIQVGTQRNFRGGTSNRVIDKVFDKRDPVEVLAKFFEQFSVVVGCADYTQNVRLTKACIQAKTNFCDLGGNNDIVEEQLALSKSAQEAGVTVIPDCGLAPGMAGLLVAYGIQRLKGATSAKMYVGGLPHVPTNPPLNYSSNWSIKGLVNEYVEQAVVLRNGEIVGVPSLSGVENLLLRDVELEAFYTSGGVSTLPKTLASKCPNIEYKTLRYRGHAAIFQVLRDLGFLEHSRLSGGESLRNITEEALDRQLKTNLCEDVVYVKVRIEHGKNSLEFTLKELADSDTGHSAMARTTGYSAAIIAKMLADGEISQQGVIPGELCVPLERYMLNLFQRGITIHEQEFQSVAI